MNRRGFLQACLAAATAPYVITSAGVLMPVRKIFVPEVQGPAVQLMRGGDPMDLLPGSFGRASVKAEGSNIAYDGLQSIYRWVRSEKVGEFEKAGWQVVTRTDPTSRVQVPLAPTPAVVQAFNFAECREVVDDYLDSVPAVRLSTYRK